MFLLLVALYSVPRHSNRFLQPLLSVLSGSSTLQFHTITSGTDGIYCRRELQHLLNSYTGVDHAQTGGVLANLTGY